MTRYTISLINGPAIESNEQEFEAIRAAKKTVLKMLTAEEKYDIVIENYLELEETLLSATVRYMATGDHGDDWFNKARNTFDRRIFNLMSAFGGYIDFAKHSAGKIADAKEALIKETNRLYDEHFSYRVIGQLRDFVVHNGLLCHYVTHSVERVPPRLSDFTLKYQTPDLALAVERLVESKKIKKQVMDEIVQRGEKVSLLPLIREYLSDLSGLHVFLRNLCQSKMDTALEVTDGIFAKFSQQHPDAEFVWLLAKKYDEEVLVEEIGFVRIPERVLDFATKNRHLPNLETRFVSNDFSKSASG